MPRIYQALSPSVRSTSHLAESRESVHVNIYRYNPQDIKINQISLV